MAKRADKKPGSRTRSTLSGEVLTAEQRRDLMALLVGALALFALLALIPLSWFGARGPELLPSGNAGGVLGGLLAGVLRAGLGIGAPVVPALLAAIAVGLAGWLEGGRLRRALMLLVGGLILAPVWAHVLWSEVRPGGALGARVGDLLLSGIGPAGSVLALVVVTVALLVLTVRWNPVRTVALGAVRGGALVTRGAGAVGGQLLRAGSAVAERRRQRAARTAASTADEHWTGPETGDDPHLAQGAHESASDPADPAPAEPDAALGGALGDALPGNSAGTRAPRATSAGAPRPEPVDLLPDPVDPRDLAGSTLPPLDLLRPEEAADREQMERELDRLGEVLVEKLRTFRVECSLGGRTTGPVVTQFEVVPAPGVKVNTIANLEADLALAMKAQSIRIVAPIPGKGAVGVEIPNPQSSMVPLRAILEAPEYRRARGALPLALGKDLTGRPYVADLGKMPHLLVAGATGSGKSVCINTVITSLIYRHTPETLRFLMIDPKMVELSAYADLPHLRHPVITDPADAAGVLKWAVLEMERRYQLLSANGTRSLAEFNRRVEDGVVLRRPMPAGEEGDPDRWIYEDGPLPYIVVVVDELADLMIQVQSEVERPLAQLAQKARAIGIHLIVATQRPTVNVITGLIKANFPTRIAFRVAAKGDSRTIIDMNGAETLLGNGDMLFLPPGQSEPVRLQGAFIDTDETDHVLGWYRMEKQRRAQEEGEGAAAVPAEPDIFEELRNHEMDEAASVVEEIAGDWDDLFRAAAEVCIQNQGGSTSLLQRRLSIGYGRAARIVDQLQDAGVLGPSDGSKPREVLMSLDELDQMMGTGG